MKVDFKVYGLLVLMAGLFTGCKVVFHTETHIPAKPEVVWKVLVDENSYSYWNEVLIPFHGEKIEEGKKVRYTMSDQNGKKSEITTEVKSMIPNKELNQYGGIPGIITFDHKYILEPTKDGTKLIQHEVDRGIYLWFWDSSWVEDAYKKSSENLKRRVIELSSDNKMN